MLLSFVMHAAWIRAREGLERQRETVNGKQLNAKTIITQIKRLREREAESPEAGGQLDHNNNNRRRKKGVWGVRRGLEKGTMFNREMRRSLNEVPRE